MTEKEKPVKEPKPKEIPTEAVGETKVVWEGAELKTDHFLMVISDNGAKVHGDNAQVIYAFCRILNDIAAQDPAGLEMIASHIESLAKEHKMEKLLHQFKKYVEDEEE